MIGENKRENEEMGNRKEIQKIEIEGKVFVVSDIHLRENDKRKDLFIDFIEEFKKKGNIILLGDIFDIWIGENKNLQKDFHKFIKAIEKSKNQIIYVEGNHDFHLRWLDEIGIPRITEEEVKINSKRFLLSHGDIYSGELSHKIYRKTLIKSENILKFLINGYFDSAINKVGQIIANLSRKRYINPKASRKRRKIFSSMLSNAIKIAKQKNLDGVIFGHCHIPSLIRLEDKIYINSGFWSENYGTYIEIQDKDDIVIREWNK